MTTPTARTSPTATMKAIPAMTVPVATCPSSKRGTITWSVTHWMASDEATVATANTAAPVMAMAKVRGLNDIAARRGQTLAQLALVWALRDPRMTSLVIGASSVRQLEQNVAALDNLTLSADELAEIDKYATEADINLWASQSSE